MASRHTRRRSPPTSEGSSRSVRLALMLSALCAAVSVTGAQYVVVPREGGTGERSSAAAPEGPGTASRSGSATGSQNAQIREPTSFVQAEDAGDDVGGASGSPYSGAESTGDYFAVSRAEIEQRQALARDPVTERDISGTHCGTRHYDTVEVDMLEQSLLRRELQAVSRARAIQEAKERGDGDGTSVASALEGDDRDIAAASAQAPWAGVESFTLPDVPVNFNIFVDAEGVGDVSDFSINCQLRRLNIAFANVDPTEETWVELGEDRVCDLTEEDFDELLTQAQQDESFGTNSGITFVKGTVTRYLSLCGEGADDPDRCDQALDEDEPFPSCTSGIEECGETGADFLAPASYFSCRNGVNTAIIAERIVRTQPEELAPESHINVVSCEAANGGGTPILGFVICISGGDFTLGPCPVPEDSPLNAIFVLYTTFPGLPVTLPNFNQGDTLSHEMGHALGLFHTFGNPGCPAPGSSCSGSDSRGDIVCDTGPENRPKLGRCSATPSPLIECPSSPGSDVPVATTSFMNYVNDSCMDRFSLGQVERMQRIVTAFKPTLCENTAPGGQCNQKKCELGEWSEWSECVAESCFIDDGITFGSGLRLAPTGPASPSSSLPVPPRLDLGNEETDFSSARAAGPTVAAVPRPSDDPGRRRGLLETLTIATREQIASASTALREGVAAVGRMTVLSREASERSEASAEGASPESQPVGAVNRAVSRSSGMMGDSGSPAEPSSTALSSSSADPSTTIGQGIETRTREILVDPVGDLPENQCEGSLTQTRSCNVGADFSCECPPGRRGMKIELGLGGCASRTSVEVMEANSGNKLFSILSIPGGEDEATVSLCLPEGVVFVSITAGGCTSGGGFFSGGLDACGGGVGYQISTVDFNGVEFNEATVCGSLESDNTVVKIGDPAGCYMGPWSEWGPCRSYCSSSTSRFAGMDAMATVFNVEDAVETLLDDLARFSALNSTELGSRSSEFRQAYPYVARALFVNDNKERGYIPGGKVRVDVRQICQFLQTDSRLPFACVGYGKSANLQSSSVVSVSQEFIRNFINDIDMDSNGSLDAGELEQLMDFMGRQAADRRGGGVGSASTSVSPFRVGSQSRTRSVVYNRQVGNDFCAVNTFETRSCQTFGSSCINVSPTPSPITSPSS